jgi:two-component system, NarL family, sensor histidine kinase UhpB
VFRIFQEILTNVTRHAEGTEVRTHLSVGERDVILEVTDDGRGITEEERTDRGSLGLLGMRERAAMLGGDVRFDGVAGRGTTVTVRIPRASVRSVAEEPKGTAAAEEVIAGGSE